MKLRTLTAGLILTLAIAPTAMAAPVTGSVTALAPQPVAGSSTTVSPQFLCLLFPRWAICRQ